MRRVFQKRVTCKSMHMFPAASASVGEPSSLESWFSFAPVDVIPLWHCRNYQLPRIYPEGVSHWVSVVSSLLYVYTLYTWTSNSFAKIIRRDPINSPPSSPVPWIGIKRSRILLRSSCVHVCLRRLLCIYLMLCGWMTGMLITRKPDSHPEIRAALCTTREDSCIIPFLLSTFSSLLL